MHLSRAAAEHHSRGPSNQVLHPPVVSGGHCQNNQLFLHPFRGRESGEGRQQRGNSLGGASGFGSFHKHTSSSRWRIVGLTVG